MTEKLKYWVDLFIDAQSKRQTLDNRAKRRKKLYEGTGEVIDPKTGQIANKKVKCFRNMCFELIETQINNSIPAPKVTPRDAGNIDLAQTLEGYLQMEMDRMESERMNDAVERETLIQGNAFYLVGWDETKNTPITSGELFVKFYPLLSVYPQPGITQIEDAEYIFTIDTVSVKQMKDLYNVDVPEGDTYKGMNELITAWYYNKEGYVSKFGWIKDTEIVVFDYEDYELRQIKVCKDCETPLHDAEICPVCGSNKYKYIRLEEETFDEDLVMWNVDDPQDYKVLVKKGSSLPYYKIRQLPFVLRKNISKPDDLYGVSDVDLLEKNQESMNKILTKLEENILKAGSFVTKPAGVNIPNNDETLKVVTIKDPQMMKAFSVQTVQANIQQDNILQEQLYQMGRDTLGITDSYQGKRDTTAESGKAKMVSAAQAAGRMESKRRMKDAAYADLYSLMFKFLLAYCDEPRTFSKVKPDGTYEDGKFNRYNFIQGEIGAAYYNDRFLFSVDDASTLANNRTALWQEATNNFTAGTFGNPADPASLLLYWNMMKGLNYPLAKQAVANLQQRSQQLPYELQAAIMANPQILETVRDVIVNGGEDSKGQGGVKNVQDYEQ